MRSVCAALFVFALLGFASGCKHPDSDVDTRPESVGQLLCAADSVEELDLLPKLPTCSADDSSCRDACQAGDAASCLSRAYAVQKKSSDGKEAIHYTIGVVFLGPPMVALTMLRLFGQIHTPTCS